MSNEDGSGPAFPEWVRNPGYQDGGYLLPGISQRAYAAIHLRVPDSGLPWLDAMIERARRDEFAKAVFSQVAQTYAECDPKHRELVAETSHQLVTAILAQGRKG